MVPFISAYCNLSMVGVVLTHCDAHDGRCCLRSVMISTLVKVGIRGDTGGGDGLGQF